MFNETRLPRNEKEGLLYGFIIALITSLVMITLNVSTEVGRIDGEVVLTILKSWPIMLVVAMLMEALVAGRIASRLLQRFSDPSDGFNAKILFTILFTVTVMSATLTIIASLIFGGLNMDAFTHWPEKWPRNFAVALWCEILIAQPPARFAMKKLHACQDRAAVATEGGTHV